MKKQRTIQTESKDGVIRKILSSKVRANFFKLSAKKSWNFRLFWLSYWCFFSFAKLDDFQSKVYTKGDFVFVPIDRRYN